MTLARRIVPATVLFLTIAGGVTLAQSTSAPTTAPASQPTTQGSAIPWDQTTKHVGETATVTGPVVGIHALSDGKRVVLNVGKDFPAPDRFSVFVTLGDNAPDAEATYVGKTISVTGKIEVYKDVDEIRAKAADVIVQK